VLQRGHPAPPQLSVSATGSSSSSSSSSILYNIIRRLISTDTDSSAQQLGAEVLTLCLDPKKTQGYSLKQCFFEYYIHWLVVPFRSSAGVGEAIPAELSAELSAEQASCKLLVCDLLTFLVSKHVSSTHAYLMGNAVVIVNVVRLLQYSEWKLQVRSRSR
jgi:hypothetical protein